MPDVRFGRRVRAVRLHRRLRQVDVARRASCHQSVVSVIERGDIEEVSLSLLRRVCAALDIDLLLTPRWRGGEIDQLVDSGHAMVVEHVAALLRRRGWIVDAEVSFNVFGERGSVDLVGWHPGERALVLVEAKTVLTDLQALLLSMSRKVRHVPEILERDRGWKRRSLGRLLVVIGTTANRSVVERHESLFASTFPAGSNVAKAWLALPRDDLAAVWFVSPMALAHGSTRPARRFRSIRARTGRD